MRKDVFVDCTNYFNEVGCKRLKEAIETGDAVYIYIDCIGHTATMLETSRYVDWLRKTYGDKLVETKNEYGDNIYYLED